MAASYAGGGAGAAAAAAAIANAIKASGAIVKMNPEEFLKILNKAENSVVVYSHSKVFFTVKHKYLLSYRGLFFYTESASTIAIPSRVETVTAQKIWIPG